MINSLWNKLDSGLSSVENAAMVLILFGMLVLAVAQILLRNVSGGGLIWIDPLLRIAVLWIAMIGAMIGTRNGSHIAVDVVSHYTHGKVRVAITRLLNSVSAAICILMAWASVRFVIDEANYGTEAFSELPAWPFEVIIPVGFVIMALRFSVQIFYINERKSF